MHRVVVMPVAADEPLTIEELREHLSLSVLEGGTHPDDALIKRLGRAARAACEEYTEVAYARQTWEVAYQSWYDMLTNGLPGGKVNSIESVTYRDDLNAQIVLDDGFYELDDFGPITRIREQATNETAWPSLGSGWNPIVVRVVVGDWREGEPPVHALPEDVRAAMLLLVGDFYVHREDTSPAPMQTMPNGVRALLNPHRVGLGV